MLGLNACDGSSAAPLRAAFCRKLLVLRNRLAPPQGSRLIPTEHLLLRNRVRAR